MLTHGAASLLAITLFAAAADDPRIPLVEAQLSGRLGEALTHAERLLETAPERSRALGLDYLRGRLLDATGKPEEATQAFLAALTATPELSRHGYYRLALEYQRLGHPEMAAGLVARVVADGSSFVDLAAATELLRSTLAAGGDCRLLREMGSARLPATQRREVNLAQAECALREGDEARARRLLVDLLRQDRNDEPGREAAELVIARLLRPGDQELMHLVGLTLHDHRQYARSSALLDPLLNGARRFTEHRAEEFATRYARVRNDFWLGRYAAAAEGFGALTTFAGDARKQADAHFQRGRSLELLGDWQGAASSYRRTFQADPNGTWGGAGLLAAMRLELRGGSERTALELYELLTARSRSQDYLGRAAMFLAASDLARGRGDRAARWLADAERSGGASASEVAYWRGRLAEIEGEAPRAAAAYLAAMRDDPHDPFARQARARLAAPPMAAAAEELGLRLAAAEDRYGAWLVLGEGHPRGRLALTALNVRLRADRRARPYLLLRQVPVAEWPLWRVPLDGAEDRLLALGLWHEGAPAVSRHFPVSAPDLAVTGSHHLAAVGETRKAMTIVEVLDRRRPSSVPARLLPAIYRELLYPLPYRSLIDGAAASQGVDPHLLAGIIREESRYDPRALSNASARGLTQLILPTAQRYAPRLQMLNLEPEDLYRPEVSIPLAAAYLGDLGREFEGAQHAVAAAYNAGEHQARLWMTYCFTKDPAEYYSKVGFRQTRHYVRKVLTSRAHYEDLYGRRDAG